MTRDCPSCSLTDAILANWQEATHDADNYAKLAQGASDRADEYRDEIAYAKGVLPFLTGAGLSLVQARRTLLRSQHAEAEKLFHSYNGVAESANARVQELWAAAVVAHRCDHMALRYSGMVAFPNGPELTSDDVVLHDDGIIYLETLVVGGNGHD